MLTQEDFILKFDSYTDEELYMVHAEIDNYSIDAQKALEIVLQKKGGLDGVIERLKEKKALLEEYRRIEKEVTAFTAGGSDFSLIKTLVKSDKLTQDQLNDTVQSAYAKAVKEAEDRKINPRTIWGSIIGGGIASIIGGILWGLQIIFSHRIFYIFIIGLALLNYGIIKILTRQSKNNNVVLIATAISIIVAILIGMLLYQIAGYRG
jgi:hypothetical protein